jgi:DNA-directed RNA polymerase subunit RPC12/RpoP
MTIREYIIRRARLGALVAMGCTLIGALLVRFALPPSYGYDERMACVVAAILVFLLVRFAMAWTTRCPRCRHSLFFLALGLSTSRRRLERCSKCGQDFGERMPKR